MDKTEQRARSWTPDMESKEVRGKLAGVLPEYYIRAIEAGRVERDREMRTRLVEIEASL